MCLDGPDAALHVDAAVQPAATDEQGGNEAEKGVLAHVDQPLSYSANRA